MKKSFGKRQAFGKKSGTFTDDSKKLEFTNQLHEETEIKINKEIEGGKIKSFFVACVSGLTFSVIVSSLIDGVSAPGVFGGKFFLNLMSGMVMLTMAPIIFIPARILADIMSILQVPRGYSDIMIGSLIGSIMFMPNIVMGDPLRGTEMAFVFGGAIGGFSYWRSRGYPGLKQKHNQLGDFAHKALKRL